MTEILGLSQERWTAAQEQAAALLQQGGRLFLRGSGKKSLTKSGMIRILHVAEQCSKQGSK